MQARDLYDELERKYDEARVRSRTIKQELNSFDKVMMLLNEHITENLETQKSFLEERKITILKESYDKLQAKYERYRKAKIQREDDYKRQLVEDAQLESHLNQIASIKKIQENQDSVFDYDVESINFLNECNWNLGDSCDRSLAETLLSCFPSGTFLVRSSKTKANSFALSVVSNSVVRHCLIDKIGEEYCFHPHGPQRQTYPSLCGLVMDYRHKSLWIHNPELDTNLIYPVLSQLKKTSKGFNTNVHDTNLLILAPK